MGYRARLGKIPKTAREKYSGKTFEEVQAMMDNRSSPYYPPEHTQLYEMGKYLDLKGNAKNFYDFDMEDYEAEFHILSKEGLKSIIQWYHDQVKQHYKNLLKHLKDGHVEQIEQYFIGKDYEWDNEWIQPYWLDHDKSDGKIVRSWKIEYAIFNIVYIYRTFDWENDYLIYSGW